MQPCSHAAFDSMAQWFSPCFAHLAHRANLRVRAGVTLCDTMRPAGQMSQLDGSEHGERHALTEQAIGVGKEQPILPSTSTDIIKDCRPRRGSISSKGNESLDAAVVGAVGGRFDKDGKVLDFFFAPEFERAENKFIAYCMLPLVALGVFCVIYAIIDPGTFGTLGDKFIYINATGGFVFEMFVRYLMSHVVLRYRDSSKRIINYTRKLGNAVRVPKYFFIDDLLPDEYSTACSLLLMFAIDQTLYIIAFSHYVRSKDNCFCRLLRFTFLSQDRPEDRPDTLRMQVTEDLMRFAIYLPFRLWFGPLSHDSVVYIPIFVNTVGDGLAEPVGIFFSRFFHARCGWDVTYKTRSLYTTQGGWWSGDFVRSYPGSSCVFVTSVLSLVVMRDLFTSSQFYFLLFTFPYWMTMAEAYAPHTNDGPMLAIVGCGLLIFAFQMFPRDETCSG